MATACNTRCKQLDVDCHELEYMCSQCNPQQDVESSGTVQGALEMLILMFMDFVYAEACTVNHHQKSLVETIHRLVLFYEVRLVVTFFQVHQSCVFQQEFAQENKNEVCSEVGVKDHDLDAKPVIRLSKLTARTLQRAAYQWSIKKVNILCVDDSENVCYNPKKIKQFLYEVQLECHLREQRYHPCHHCVSDKSQSVQKVRNKQKCY